MHEAFLGGVVEDVAVEGAGLAEVVILSVLDVGGAHQVGALRVRVDVEVLGEAEVLAAGGGFAVVEVAGALLVGVRAVVWFVLFVEEVCHGAALCVGVHLVDRAVDRQILVVGADAVALLVSVRKDAGLKHAVWGQADTWDQVGWVECQLLDLCVEVLRVAVEDEVADVDKRVVLLRPRLGEVERVEAVVLRFLERHDLHLDVPDWVVPLLDGIEEVLALEVRVRAGLLGGFFVGEAFPALAGLEVVLDPNWDAFLVDPLEGVGAESVLVTGGLRSAAVAE